MVGSTPAPPTPPAIRVVLLHTEQYVQSFNSPTVYLISSYIIYITYAGSYKSMHVSYEKYLFFSDLAHLLLTSTSRDYRKEHWDEVVKHYYDVFNRTLAEFGLVLRHLGTSYNDFLCS